MPLHGSLGADAALVGRDRLEGDGDRGRQVHELTVAGRVDSRLIEPRHNMRCKLEYKARQNQRECEARQAKVPLVRPPVLLCVCLAGGYCK